MTFQKENNVVMKNFLGRTFFNSWQNWEKRKSDSNSFLNNYSGLEFDISDACELNCKYCYVAKHGKEYYPDVNLTKPSLTFKNAKITMDWLEVNKMRPKLELFGGDAYNQDVGFAITAEVMGRALAGRPICTEIIVPTNMNFLFSEDRIKTIDELLAVGKKTGSPLYLSASVDGIYMEENRSFRTNKVRDEKFYDRLFRFAKQHSIGFHPMVYSNNIEKWWGNFMWYQEKFKEYGLPPNNIYLLEVRNAEWTEEQCHHLYEFTRKLAKWVSGIIKTKPDPIKEFFKNHWSFNMLSTPFSQIGRGIGCSLQSGIYLRLGDLTTFPCHRLMYDYFKLFRFVIKNNKITDIETYNPELYIATNSMDAKNFPMCEQCLLEPMCSHGCLGAQFETTGDMFVPIPSMCRMEHYKIKGILDGFRDGGMLDMILNAITPQKRIAVLAFLKEK